MNTKTLKIHQKYHRITAERPGHAGQLPQTDILLESEEAWVWGEVLVVAVPCSYKPSERSEHWLQNSVRMWKCRNLM